MTFNAYFCLMADLQSALLYIIVHQYPIFPQILKFDMQNNKQQKVKFYHWMMQIFLIVTKDCLMIRSRWFQIYNGKRYQCEIMMKILLNDSQSLLIHDGSKVGLNQHLLKCGACVYVCACLFSCRNGGVCTCFLLIPDLL